MNFFRLRVFLLALAVLTTGVAMKGQNAPKAELLDEFGLIPCGHLHALTDSYAEEIKKEPGTKAIVLIYPPSHRPELADKRRKLISSILQLRGLDHDRFSFYKAASSPDGEIRTQYWKAVDGAEMPFREAVSWAENVPDTTRAFMFGYAEEINICPTFVPRAFAKLILNNPGSTGRIVVEAGKDSMENQFAFAEGYMTELVVTEGLPRKRLRLIFKKGKDGTSAEFWFVPAKR